MGANPEVALADGGAPMTAVNEPAVQHTLEMTGIEFIDENGGGWQAALQHHGS